MEWTGARYADKPTVEVETFVEAPPENVWRIVSDINLMPELSDEVQRVEWQDGATGPSVGARFVGYNKHEAFGEWQTTSIVTECAQPSVFAWAVGDVEFPGAIWRFSLEPKGGGTTLRQWVQMGPARSGLSVAIERMPDKEQKIVFVRMREYEAGMAANLAEIKARAERDPAAGQG
jgi:ligand-binding SRPBCC domain-containing protein